MLLSFQFRIGEFGKIPWRREQQPTPVFWPGESPWTEEPVGYSVHGVAKSWTQLSDFHFTSLWVFGNREDKVNLLIRAEHPSG